MQSDSRMSFLSGPGGLKEVMRLALPLIISQGFWTLQITIDRVLLSRYDSDAVGAALGGAIMFWTPFTLAFGTASYAATFVAQYLGANRADRIGPAVWQALWFSLAAGIGFCLMAPFGGFIIGIMNHSPELQALEVEYFRCLCYSALPMLLMHSAVSFFLGRGKTWVVMIVNASGMVVNAILDYGLIFGNLGFPEWGITGAGWATFGGSAASAFVALGLLFWVDHKHAHEKAASTTETENGQPKIDSRYILSSDQFGLYRGWRIDWALFRRLMRFGVPSGLQWTMEGLALNIVTIVIGQMGAAQLSATSIAFTVNMLAFLPTMGVAQAVTVLVGQHLGEDRPDIAARSTWSGCALAWTFMATVATTFVLLPEMYMELFRTQDSSGAVGENWHEVAALTPILLRFVAFYCLFDSMYLVFSSALKGAGDTRYVTMVTLLAAWLVMVTPTIIAYQYGAGLYAAWISISAYVFCLAVVFFLRFLQGKWKSMRVIEAIPESDRASESVVEAAPTNPHIQSSQPPHIELGAVDEDRDSVSLRAD